MIESAFNIARSCRELVNLANISGFYPILDKPLEMNVTAVLKFLKNVFFSLKRIMKILHLSNPNPIPLARPKKVDYHMMNTNGRTN